MSMACTALIAIASARPPARASAGACACPSESEDLRPIEPLPFAMLAETHTCESIPSLDRFRRRNAESDRHVEDTGSAPALVFALRGPDGPWSSTPPAAWPPTTPNRWWRTPRSPWARPA